MWTVISLSVSVTDDLKSLVLSLQARVDKLDGGERERVNSQFLH